MINIKNKKISLSVLLISIVLIIFISILKEKRRFPIYPYGRYDGYKIENVIRFLDIQLSYNNTLFFLFIAVILSILTLIFLDDIIIKNKTGAFYRRFSTIKIFKQKISNLLKKSINRIIIGVVALIIILVLIGNCNKPKNTILTETNIEAIDTVALANDVISKEQVDSTIAIEISPIEKTMPNNSSKTIDPFNLEELHKAANTGIGKTISEARQKFTPNAQIGDLTSQSVSDDQLQNLYGNGTSTLSKSNIETARSKRSK
jgi:hypothetical protein